MRCYIGCCSTKWQTLLMSPKSLILILARHINSDLNSLFLYYSSKQPKVYVPKGQTTFEITPFRQLSEKSSRCVSKTQVVHRKYLQGKSPNKHTNTAGKRSESGLTQSLRLQVLLTFSFLPASRLLFLLLSSSPPPPAVYYCEVWQDDAGLFPPHLTRADTEPVLPAVYNSLWQSEPSGVPASNTGHETGYVTCDAF